MPLGKEGIKINTKLLSQKEQELVFSNQKLVGSVYNRLIKKVNIPSSQNEDYIQEGMFALCRAAQTYDENKGFAFSTYASKVIYNQMLFYFRTTCKHNGVISLSTPVESENPDDISDFSLETCLMDPSSDRFVGEIETKEYLDFLVSTTINMKNERTRKIALEILNSIFTNTNATQIASCHGVSRQYVSSIREKLQKQYCRMEGGKRLLSQ